MGMGTKYGVNKVQSGQILGHGDEIKKIEISIKFYLTK